MVTVGLLWVGLAGGDYGFAGFFIGLFLFVILVVEGSVVVVVVAAVTVGGGGYGCGCGYGCDCGLWRVEEMRLRIKNNKKIF